jgi:hypothetical protein
MGYTDRLNGVNAGLALKAPVRLRTTANITLFGHQTIDGGLTEDNDRVLVMAQSTGYENGIYYARSGQWVRCPDWDGAFDITKGTMVKVQEGTLYAGYWYEVTNDDPVIGTTAITFEDSTSAVAAAANASGYADDAAASAAAAAASEAGVASDAADAEAARAAAVIAKDAAVAAKVAAETAETNAETAEANAEIAQAAAEEALASATTQANNAASSASDAQDAQTAAETAQSGAETAQAAAEAAATALSGTSTSNVTIGTGAKSFTTQASKQFYQGGFVMITSDADPTNDYLFGQVTSYVGTTLQINALVVGGNGEAHSDWTINVAGHRGATGDTGPQGDPGADGADGADGDDAYVYVAWADNVNGDGFTNTFQSDKEYMAFKTTTSPLSPPIAADFAGLWFAKGGPQGETGATGAQGPQGDPGDSSYTYIAYASADDGADFTMTFNAALDYIAIKTTTSPIAAPTAGDFAGLWKNYKGATGDTGPQGDPGGSLTYFTDVQNTTAPNDTIEFIALDFTSTAPYDGGFDFKGYDSVSGTGGAFSLQIPDGTAAGGNKRGTGAIDLSTRRSAAGQVASGLHSILIGNRGISAGARSIVIGEIAGSSEDDGIAIGSEAFNDTGASSTAIGTLAYTFGAEAVALGKFASSSGAASIAIGTSSGAEGQAAVAVGGTCFAGNASAIAIGPNSESVGEFAIAFGALARASTDEDIAIGHSAVAETSGDGIAIGTFAYVGGPASIAIGESTDANAIGSTILGASGSDRFINHNIVLSSGNGQVEKIILLIDTIDDTPTVLTTDALSPSFNNQVTVFNGSIATITGTIIAMDTDTYDAKAWRVEVVAKTTGESVTSLLGVPTITVISEDSAANSWDINVSVDTENNAVSFTATGGAATNISWMTNLDVIGL